MKDTPQHITDLQYQIYMSKTPEERFALGIAFIEFHGKLIRAGIKAQYPDYTEEQITKEFIKRIKQQDRSLDWLELD
ncbi:MAG TPA: hypothetical protein PK239_12730 [Chitinophagales bacterium]|nr:hypothetical protein [Chitinophagales bacterium]